MKISAGNPPAMAGLRIVQQPELSEVNLALHPGSPTRTVVALARKPHR